MTTMIDKGLFAMVKLQSEIEKLKGLLKECRDRFDTHYDELRKKIDEVLK